MARMRRPKAPPKVAYTLLTRDLNAADYDRLDRLVRDHHDELLDARIALAWCSSWRADADGHQKLGQCRRASALDRQLMDFDFVILLQQTFWQSELVTTAQRDALLDHELCHATTKDDPATGDPMQDERGQTIYRIRHHDLEEFREIVERHGLWKQDIERFASAIVRAREHPKLPLDESSSSDDEPTQVRTH